MKYFKLIKFRIIIISLWWIVYSYFKNIVYVPITNTIVINQLEDSWTSNASLQTINPLLNYILYIGIALTLFIIYTSYKTIIKTKEINKNE